MFFEGIVAFVFKRYGVLFFGHFFGGEVLSTEAETKEQEGLTAQKRTEVLSSQLGQSRI